MYPFQDNRPWGCSNASWSKSIAFLSGIACVVVAACSSAGTDNRATRIGGATPVPQTNAGAPATTNNTFGNDFGNGSSMPIKVDMTMSNNGPALGCKGLQCQQHSCPGGGGTTISGKVYDPALKNPLYNVAVYIPNDVVEPLKLGANCDPCAKLYTGKAVASALTDSAGEFSIKDAPDGANIPLVVQIGKWRKQFTLPSVSACQDNRLPDKSLALPKNHMEGDIPNIAISTGGADTLECLLRRIGVDAAEYVPGNMGDGRIHIFQGTSMMNGGLMIPGLPAPTFMAPNTSPAAPSSATALWKDTAELMKYDVVLLSCEGQETEMMNQQNLHDYASAGGRVFASHFHYSWFNSGPYNSENLATWSPGPNPMNDINADIITTFPKGMALQQWLMNNKALTNGQLPIKQARHNADVSMQNTPSRDWIVADKNADPAGATQYFSFNTPTDAAMTPDGAGYCGRVVFSDLHVGGATMDHPDEPVPTSCANVDLSPQEKALEFMLFDLSACIIPDDRPPVPPAVLQ